MLDIPIKRPQKEDNDRTQRDRQMECSERKQMSLFEHFFRHSLRFYHMSLVWTPPCSALLYSVYADAFLVCLASFFLFMFGFVITFLTFNFHLIVLSSPYPLFFSFASSFPTLMSFSHLPLPAFSVRFLQPLLFSEKMRNTFKFSGLEQASSSVALTDV